MATEEKTLLITGASGFVGAELLRRLFADEERGGFERIVATDIRGLPEDLEGKPSRFETVDIRDEAAVVELFEEERPNCVVHLAAMVTPPPGDHRQLQYEVDVVGTRNVIAGCLAAWTEQFIYTSSGAAYGYHSDNPPLLREEDPLRGNEVFAYAHHKRLVEEDLAVVRRDHPELKQLIFRVSTVLGPATDNQITALFEQALVPGIRGADSPFCIICDEDVVGAILHGISTGKGGIYNLTGEGVLTLEEIAGRMGGRYLPLPERLVRAALSGMSAVGVSPYGPEQTLFLKHRPVMDNAKLVEEFGYEPRMTSEEAFERYRRGRSRGAGEPVVLITGAGGGLGRELAGEHARRGHRLVLVDRDAEELERAYMMVRARGAEAVRLVGDICDVGHCNEAVEAAEERFGGVDILYNNAGIPLRALFEESDADEVKRVMDVNFLGAVQMTEAALDLLRTRRGRVAVTSSVAGFAPLVGRSAYAASKHALHGFFESLRCEVEGDGVSVSLICPGYLNTKFRDHAADGAEELDVSEAARVIVDAVDERQPLVLVGRTARMAGWVRRLAPGAFEKLMRRSVAAEFPT